VAGPERRRSRNWRFADAGSRFDNNPRLAERDREPISPTFTRKIVRCRRCGSRIVSNARRCPYCSKSVIPFYKSFIFWLIAVALLGAGTVYFVVVYKPADIPSPATSSRDPVAIGLANQTNASNLPIGTTVDCSDLLVTVVSISHAYNTSDGRPIYEVIIQFMNKTTSRQSLLATQWVMHTTDGNYVECYIGSNSSGDSLTSGVEGKVLAVNEVFTTRIYFATANPSSLLFLMNPLGDEDSPDISWRLDFLIPDSPTNGQSPDQSPDQPPSQSDNQATEPSPEP
jgi:hypothetical protein